MFILNICYIYIKYKSIIYIKYNFIKYVKYKYILEKKRHSEDLKLCVSPQLPVAHEATLP